MGFKDLTYLRVKTALYFMETYMGDILDCTRTSEYVEVDDSGFVKRDIGECYYECHAVYATCYVEKFYIGNRGDENLKRFQLCYGEDGGEFSIYEYEQDGTSSKMSLDVTGRDNIKHLVNKLTTINAQLVILVEALEKECPDYW